MKKYEDYMYRLINDLEVSQLYTGKKFIARILYLLEEDETRLHCISKLIYFDVANYYGTSPACVERNIRTLIRIIWDSGSHDYLEKIAQHELKKRPANKAFIDMINDHYKHHASE